MFRKTRQANAAHAALRRRRKLFRVLLALCVLVVPAAAVAGNEGVSGDPVATVDGEPIEMEAFDHWMAVAATSSGRPNASLPTPRKYGTLRDQVLQLLISHRWLEGEASDRGISVTDSEVSESFDRQRKQSFSTDADYQRFLTDSRQTEQDVLLRVRLDLLWDKIGEQVTKGRDRVTDKQVADYYRLNKAHFGRPDQPTLEQIEPTIRQVLAADNRQEALDDFLDHFRRKWRARTECREGYEMQDCA